jgi:fido (protein-threonine AMPylation protein)
MAGNYRGAPYPCLWDAVARIRNDEGFPPALVHAMMTKCCREMLEALNYLDALHQNPRVEDHIKKLHTVEIATHVLGGFNRVHPFANGNGHVSRFLVFSILMRNGYRPKNWDVGTRGDDAMFAAYYSGSVVPMFKFILEKIS